jgi:hypothetical protein
MESIGKQGDLFAQNHAIFNDPVDRFLRLTRVPFDGLFMM